MSDRYKILLLLVVVSILCSLHLNRNLDTGGDNARYIILARSLLEGKGYRDSHLVGEPYHTAIPFVFPSLLIPVLYFFGYNLLALKVVPFLFGIASIFMAYIVIRNLTNEHIAIRVALLFGICKLFVTRSTVVLSEGPYLFFMLSVLIFFNRYKRDKRWSSINGFFLILFLLLSFFTRTIGIVLLLATLFSLRKNVKKGALVLLLFTLPALLWFFRAYSLKELSTSEYNLPSFFLKDFFNPDLGYMNISDVFHRILNNGISYLKVLAAILVGNEMFLTIGLCFLLVIVYRFAWHLFVRRTIIEYYIIVNFAILLILPCQIRRYLVPILPFIFYYLVSGIAPFMERVEKELSRKSFFWLLFAFALIGSLPFLLIRTSSQEYWGTLVFGRYSVPYFTSLLLIFTLAVISVVLFCSERLRTNMAEFLHNNKRIISIILLLSVIFFNFIAVVSPPYGPQYIGVFREYYEMGQYIKVNTPPDAIIMTIKPNLMHLWTGRKMSWVYPFTKDEQRIKEYIFDRGVDYAIFSPELVTGLDERYLAPVIEKNITVFEEVYSIGKTKLFKIRVDP